MRSLGTRRAVLAAGAATVAVLALGGCSAGQVAETAILDTPISGVDRETLHASVFIRNLVIPYNDVHGYKAGSNAPIELSLYNQTDDPITVAISSRPTEQAQVVSARQVGIAPAGPASEAHGSEAPSEAPSEGPSGAPEEPAAEIKPAEVTLPAQGSALFRPTDSEQLQVFGLSGDLIPGTSVNLVFEFSDGSPDLELQAPVATPLEPAPRVSAGEEFGEGEGH